MRNVFPLGTKAGQPWREQILVSLRWPKCAQYCIRMLMALILCWAF